MIQKIKLDFIEPRAYPQGGGGGGVVLWYFHTYVGSVHILKFKIFNFDIFGVFRKKIFLGMKIL